MMQPERQRFFGSISVYANLENIFVCFRFLVESWHYTTFSRTQRKLNYKEHLYGPTANCFNALEKI